MISLADLEAARRRLAPFLRPTPTERSDSLSALAGRPVLLKPEQRQRTGSFKVRGALNCIAQLPAGLDVVAASAGNHAQGVALAARLDRRRATLYMPAGAALPKVEATRSYGAEVRFAGTSVEEAIAAALAHAEAEGVRYVPPFDDPDVIAGQGTVGLELLEEAPHAEVVVVPVGGGGLISGVAAALTLGAPSRGRPPVRVVGVEAAGAPSMTAALAAGHPVRLEHVETMADGLAVRACSARTLAHVQAYVDQVVLVEEEEISRAMLLLVERTKAVVEPSGAAALAAVLAGRVPGSGPAVAVLSGGNVDPLLLTRLIEHGLSAAGRYLTLRVVTADRPGALAALAAEIARMGVNVLDVEHHRSRSSLALAEVEVTLTVETRDAAQHREVLGRLRDGGYRAEPLA